MGLFGGKKFQYVAGVTPSGKPVMSTVKAGNRKGQCGKGEGYCEEHKTLKQWEHYSKWAGVMPTEDEIADQLGWIFKDPSKMKVSQPISMDEYLEYERENNPSFIVEEKPLQSTNPYFTEGDAEVCEKCGGRVGFMGNIEGVNIQPCICN